MKIIMGMVLAVYDPWDTPDSIRMQFTGLQSDWVSRFAQALEDNGTPELPGKCSVILFDEDVNTLGEKKRALELLGDSTARTHFEIMLQCAALGEDHKINED